MATKEEQIELCNRLRKMLKEDPVDVYKIAMIQYQKRLNRKVADLTERLKTASKKDIEYKQYRNRHTLFQ